MMPLILLSAIWHSTVVQAFIFHFVLPRVGYTPRDGGTLAASLNAGFNGTYGTIIENRIMTHIYLETTLLFFPPNINEQKHSAGQGNQYLRLENYHAEEQGLFPKGQILCESKCVW